MPRHVCWDPELVRRFFTTEASTKTETSDFLRLHLPVERIRVLDAKPMVFPEASLRQDGGETYTDEQGLLAAVVSAPLETPNRIFVVVGEPGAGKSHLARWVEYSLEATATRLPIHIPRHVDTLPAVVERLAEKTGVAVTLGSTRRIVEAPAGALAKHLAAGLEVELGPGTRAGEEDRGLAAVVESRALRELVERQIVRYQLERTQTDSGFKTREILELGDAELEAVLANGRRSADPATRARRKERLARAFREGVARLLNLDAFDLKRLLAEISRRCVAQGKRPVLAWRT